MKKTRFLSSLLLLVLAFMLMIPMVNAAGDDVVYRVPVHKEVEKGLHAYMERAFKEAKENGADVIVLDIHTPGGSVEAVEEIAVLMDSSDIKIIAYINAKALSAGAFIALHADEIYMTKNGTIGAAGVITGDGNAANEKAQSAWIANMKAAASANGLDPQYAEAMANPDIDLPEYRAGIGKFLTLTADEAIKVGYAKGIANSLDEMLVLAGYENAEVTSVDITFAEQLARFVTNPIIVPILLSIASVGLVLELYSPGFGIPGSMALGSIGLFFFGHSIAGFAGFETLIIFVIGFILVIAEFFVPGGILGVIGGSLILISLLFAGASVTHMAYSILIAMFVAVVGMVVIMKFFGKKLHIFSKLVLKDATTSEEGYVSNENRDELVGKTAVTLTPLRPSGVADCEGERLDVVSEGNFIDNNKQVKIVKVEGSRIVVREVKEKNGGINNDY